MAGETYVQRWGGGFVNTDVSRPVDATFLNAVESALLKLLGEDPSADEVGVWVPGSNRFVFQKIVNANVDAAAAIARSKLDFGSGLTNSDIAAAAAIAKSKLAALAIVDADVSAISKSKITGLAIPYGTSLPGSPSDGDEAILVDSTTAPTFHWRFRYNNAHASDAHKWEFIGGTPMMSQSSGGSPGTTAGDAGPTLTCPVAGVYDVMGGAHINTAYQDGGNSTIWLNVAGSDQIGAVGGAAQGGPPSMTWVESLFIPNWRDVSRAASTVFKLRWQTLPVGGSAGYKFIGITPVRVG